MAGSGVLESDYEQWLTTNTSMWECLEWSVKSYYRAGWWSLVSNDHYDVWELCVHHCGYNGWQPVNNCPVVSQTCFMVLSSVENVEKMHRSTIGLISRACIGLCPNCLHICQVWQDRWLKHVRHVSNGKPLWDFGYFGHQNHLWGRIYCLKIFFFLDWLMHSIINKHTCKFIMLKGKKNGFCLFFSHLQ